MQEDAKCREAEDDTERERERGREREQRRMRMRDYARSRKEAKDAGADSDIVHGGMYGWLPILYRIEL